MPNYLRRSWLASGWTPLAVLSCLAYTRPTWAGNDDELFVGNHAAMAGGAVAATVADASATWYNPAGLGAVTRDQIDVSATAYTLRHYSAPGFLASASGQSNDASVFEFVSIPSQVAYVRRLKPGLSIGVGYFAPQASNLLLRESLTVRNGTNESNWQFTLRLTGVQHTVAVGIGTALSRAARVGFSLIGTYEDATESIAITSLGSENGEPRKLLMESVLGSFSRLGLEMGTGFQFDLSQRFRLALAAHSARVLLNQVAKFAAAYGLAESNQGSGSLQGYIAEPNQRHTGIEVVRTGRLNMALAYLPSHDDWLTLEFDVQPAAHNESAGIDRHPVVNARTGVFHRMSQSLAVGAGLFTDRSANRLSDNVASSSGDFYGATLGTEISHRHALASDEPADSLVFSTTLALRYAYSNGIVNRLLVNPYPTSEELSTAPGRLLVHELGLYVGGSLAF